MSESSVTESRLVLLNGPTPGTTLRLDRDASEVPIGRDAAAGLRIDDQLVSRLHARVWFDGQSWQIEDCGSRNGTLVNSQRVQRAVLQPGDLIRIGDRLIVFACETNGLASSSLRPSVFTANTGVIRIAEPGKREALLEQLRGESSSRPVRNLALLCQLATAIPLATDAGRLARLASDVLRQATAATAVRIWLIGADGRLRRCPPNGPDAALGAAGSLDPGSAWDDHLLASIAINKDEALLTDCAAPACPSPSDSNSGTYGSAPHGGGSAIGVPIPGRERPRGAIECFRSKPISTLGETRPGNAVSQCGFDRDDLELVIAVAHHFGLALEGLERREQLERSNEQLRLRLAERTKLVGQSPPMRELLDQLSRVAPVASTVLVRGESGTGKELVAQSLHELSPRAAGPFVAVNCAAFQESLLESELFGHEAGAFTGADRRRLGQFERAHKGTIFLDEVGELSPACQAKLLRVLEGHPFQRLGGSEPIRVDVRVVSATHRDLRAMVRGGGFREDLYYRLRVIELRVPPLRERGDDLLDLAVTFLDRFGREVGRGPSRFSPLAAAAIVAYAWPGNVRELKNAVERAVVLGQRDEVTVEDLGLPVAPSGEMPVPQLISLEEAERRHIEFVLRAVGGNKTQACKILGIGRGTLYKKLGEPGE